MRPARALPASSSADRQAFSTLPSVKRKQKQQQKQQPEVTHRRCLSRPEDDLESKRSHEDDDDDDDDVDETGSRPSLGTLDALAFQQSILGMFFCLFA